MNIYSDFDLTLFNSYRIKARCKKAIFFDTEEEIIKYYKNNIEKPKVLLGSGHNIILSDEYYNEDFIIFNGNYNAFKIDGELIEAEAGITMLELSEIALKNNLAGLEVFYDIPSSLGGAVVMNAGASGEEIKDILVKVRFLDVKSRTVKEIFTEDANFEYRNSFFQKNTDKIVLKAWLRLKQSNKENIHEKMMRIKMARHEKQPKDFPNAGSVFKRPQGFFVGQMMEELALKGYSVGGAKISEKHGGFIVNFNNATGKDILELIEYVQSKVKAKYGFYLEVEQRII